MHSGPHETLHLDLLLFLEFHMLAFQLGDKTSSRILVQFTHVYMPSNVLMHVQGIHSVLNTVSSGKQPLFTRVTAFNSMSYC